MAKIMLVLQMLRNERINSEYCNPNFVADFAYNRGIELSSNEVVYISDIY